MTWAPITIRRLALITAVCSLSACASTSFEDLTGIEPSLPSLPKLSNPFAKPEAKLAGERIPVMTGKSASSELTTATIAPTAVVVPQITANESWSQPGGIASNAPGHLSLIGGARKKWVAKTGRGSSSRGKLSASPIIYEGRLYTLDTRGQVTSLSLGSGKQHWASNITPKNEDAFVGYGGGLAGDSGRIYAATGFGTITALNPSNGKALWNKKISEPVRTSPTAANGKVYALSLQGNVFCLDGASGEVLWKYRGLPEKVSFISNASPAVVGDLVVVPYPSGELIALNGDTGLLKWSDSLNRRSSGHGFGAMKNASRPVIAGGVVYAVGHGGRMIAVEAKSGTRLWEQPISSVSQPWVAGNAAYVVDSAGRLMALDLKTGGRIWAKALPTSRVWSGPVLAGNRLWLVSSTGLLVGVNPTTGQVTSKNTVGGKHMIAPIVARGHMYLYSDSAKVTAIN